MTIRQDSKMPLPGTKVSLIAAVGTGFVVGTGGLLLYYKLTHSRELRIIMSALDDLKREINEIKELLKSTTAYGKRSVGGRVRSRGSGYFSVHASSGEDDVYEEAIEGSSDYSSNRDYRTPEARSPTFDNNPAVIGGKLTNSEFYIEVDKYLDGTDIEKEQAFQALEQRQMRCVGDPEYLWRMSKASYLLAGIEGGRGSFEKKKELMFESKDQSAAALQLDENCANAHKWLACSMGAVAEYGGTQERIKSAYDIRDHMQSAIDLNPKDPTAHYLLGRWCFGVYMLTWIERKVAATLFGTPPTSTVEEAVEHFLQAEKLKPNEWKENMLFIAKCYIEMRNYEEAVTWLEKAKDLPTNSTDDKVIHTEVENLLTKYK